MKQLDRISDYDKKKKVLDINCADCGCSVEDCKNSDSPKRCENCTWEYCCCWHLVHNE